MKLSICIPVYNGSDTISPLMENLDSTFSNIEKEVVLVNDGSRDKIFIFYFFKGNWFQIGKARNVWNSKKNFFRTNKDTVFFIFVLLIKKFCCNANIVKVCLVVLIQLNMNFFIYFFVFDNRVCYKCGSRQNI